MPGKIELTVPEIQGHLRQILAGGHQLSPEERYSLTAALEVMSFMQRLSPGLRKAIEEHKQKSAQAHQ